MIGRLAIHSLLLVGCASALFASDSTIHFDLPATAQAVDVTPAEFPQDERLVSFPLNLSLIADALPSPQADQIVVQVDPLGGQSLVADYSPRTELSSRVAGEIEVSKSKEIIDNLNFSIGGAYSHLAHGTIGGDRGEKNTASAKYNRVAPLHVVAASGTTHRGRGVYFKLRADDRQVLEGDKQFTVVLRVPAIWRGELIEVRVEAESLSKTLSSSLTSFAGMTPKSHVVGAARFVVATHLANDYQTAKLARQLAETEQRMREIANRALHKASMDRAASRTTHISFRFDMNSFDPFMQQDRIARTMERIVFGTIDPYIDPAISQLPLEVRVAILDYLEARRDYSATTHSSLPKINATAQFTIE